MVSACKLIDEPQDDFRTYLIENAALSGQAEISPENLEQLRHSCCHYETATALEKNISQCTGQELFLVARKLFLSHPYLKEMTNDQIVLDLKEVDKNELHIFLNGLAQKFEKGNVTFVLQAASYYLPALLGTYYEQLTDAELQLPENKVFGFLLDYDIWENSLSTFSPEKKTPLYPEVLEKILTCLSENKEIPSSLKESIKKSLPKNLQPYFDEMLTNALSQNHYWPAEDQLVGKILALNGGDLYAHGDLLKELTPYLNSLKEYGAIERIWTEHLKHQPLFIEDQELTQRMIRYAQLAQDKQKKNLPVPESVRIFHEGHEIKRSMMSILMDGLYFPLYRNMEDLAGATAMENIADDALYFLDVDAQEVTITSINEIKNFKSFEMMKACVYAMLLSKDFGDQPVAFNVLQRLMGENPSPRHLPYVISPNLLKAEANVDNLKTTSGLTLKWQEAGRQYLGEWLGLNPEVFDEGHRIIMFGLSPGKNNRSFVLPEVLFYDFENGRVEVPTVMHEYVHVVDPSNGTDLIKKNRHMMAFVEGLALYVEIKFARERLSDKQYGYSGSIPRQTYDFLKDTHPKEHGFFRAKSEQELIYENAEYYFGYSLWNHIEEKIGEDQFGQMLKEYFVLSKSPDTMAQVDGLFQKYTGKTPTEIYDETVDLLPRHAPRLSTYAIGWGVLHTDNGSATDLSVKHDFDRSQNLIHGLQVDTLTSGMDSDARLLSVGLFYSLGLQAPLHWMEGGNYQFSFLRPEVHLGGRICFDDIPQPALDLGFRLNLLEVELDRYEPSSFIVGLGVSQNIYFKGDGAHYEAGLHFSWGLSFN